MRTLAAERCVACRRDSPPVTAAEVAKLRPEVPDWQLRELDGNRLAPGDFSQVFHLVIHAALQVVGFPAAFVPYTNTSESPGHAHLGRASRACPAKGVPGCFPRRED